MKAVIQRVNLASVSIENKTISKINKGLLVFLGIKTNDTNKECEYLIKKISNLRIFNDQNNLMNKSIKDLDLEILIVSQFTLYGNCKKGNRPSFTDAMSPNDAKILYDKFVMLFQKEYSKIKTGIFGADMKIELINDGPITIILDTDN